MNDQELDQLLTAHYAGKSLPRNRLVTIMPGTQGRSFFTNPWRKWAASGAAAVLVAAGFFWIRDSLEAPGLQAAREIARNHHKQLNVEFSATTMDALRQAMPKLEFTLIDSTQIPQSSFQLLGARYCSLGRQPAAQIRLSKVNGALCTLYQVRSTEELAEIPDGVWEADGVRVTLWHEKGLLLGLAEPVSSN